MVLTVRSDLIATPVSRDDKFEAYTHLVQYKHVMSLFLQNESSDNAFLCKVFPVSLGNLGLSWFNKLPPRSISSFDSLCDAFMARFVTSNKQEKEIDPLLALQKRSNETLLQYADRYWELLNEIKGCDGVISARGLKLDLTSQDEQVYDDLARQKPGSMEELMTHIEGWCQLIESKAEQGIEKAAILKAPVISAAITVATHILTPKKQVNNIKQSPKWGPKPSDFIAKKTVFTVPIYQIIEQVKDQPFFSFPNKKLGTENRKIKKPIVRCSFHNEQGHFTIACKPFKDYLEQLVVCGHLGNLIDHEKTRARA